jgi:hypothetical protein
MLDLTTNVYKFSCTKCSFPVVVKKTNKLTLKFCPLLQNLVLKLVFENHLKPSNFVENHIKSV